MSAEMVPVGRLQVATPASMALAIRAATEATTAVDERVTVKLAEFPDVTEAASIAAADAVAEKVVDLELVEGRRFASPVYAMPFLDEDGVTAGGVLTDGTFRFERPPQGVEVDPASIATMTRSSRYRFFGLGDSLTRGFDGTGDWPLTDAWPAHLDGFPDWVTIENLGVSGQTVDEASIRFGALSLTAQAGFTIPADTSPVTVTVQAGVGWRPDRTWTFEGSFAGVPGVLTRTGTATTSLTFARTSAGAATPVPAGAGFVSVQDVHAGDTGVVFLGRNDVSYDVTGAESTVVAHVLAGYDRIDAHLSSQIKNVLFVGTLNSTTEVAGSAGHAKVIAINTQAAARFGGRFFDLRGYLVNQAIYDMGLTPTPADLAAIAQDTIPPQLMIDTVHYTKATAAQVGRRLARWILERGWV